VPNDLGPEHPGNRAIPLGIRRQPIERVLLQIRHARAHGFYPGAEELEPISAADVTFGTARRRPCNIFRVHTCVSRFDDLYWQGESNHREMNRSVTNFEDALQRDTGAQRESAHAGDQTRRCLVNSEYTDEQFRCGIRDLRVLTELGSRDE
jgi:hypothetical protein